MSPQDRDSTPEQPEPEQSGQPERSKDTPSPIAYAEIGVIFTPIFETGETCLSDEFRLELARHTAANGVRWAVANNPSRPWEGNPTPFYSDTVEELHRYWINNFAGQTEYTDDDNKPTKYTKFTFIVVDDECIKSDPWEIIVACDAPDYGEADEEVKVKYFRMHFEDGSSYLNSLEHLTMTPSEAEDRTDDVLSGFPPACMMPLHNENGKWSGDLRPATREEGIKNKKRMLAQG
ncbi:MAG: hypothetical protein Q9203_001674 [Teloschistes exilis]